MTRANSTIRIKCKCGDENCRLLPTQGYDGFAYSHASDELKDAVKIKRGTKRQQSNRIRAKRSEITKQLWLAQKKVGVLKTPKKRQNKPIPKNSKKRLAELKIYRVLKKDFLKDHPFCECGLPECRKGKSYDVHHLYMGRDRGKYFLVVETWKAVSRSCHKRIHIEFSSEQLVELGLRKIDF